MSNTIGSELYAPLFSALHMGILGANYGGATPAPEFDYLVTLGSSTTREVFSLNTVLGRQEQSARKASTDAGFDIPIIGKGVGGATIANLNTNVNAYLSSLGPISSADPSRVAVLVHIGSNDIGDTDYDVMSQPAKDAMLAGANEILDKITAFGFTPILATSNSRKGTELVYQEWAERFYNPIIATRTPFWFTPPAVFDYSQFYFDNKDVPDWWQADNTHPWMATIPMQVHTIAQLASKAVLPAVSANDRFLFYFPSSAQDAGGFNAIVGAAGASLATVYNTSGTLVSGVSFGWTGAAGGSGSVRPNPGAWNVALSNNVVQSCTMYSSAATITFTANFGVAYAGRTGTLRATASSSTAGRLTKFTVGAGSVVVNASGPGVQIGEIPFTLNGSGVLVFTAAPESPSTYANVSGVEFVFS